MNMARSYNFFEIEEVNNFINSMSKKFSKKQEENPEVAKEINDMILNGDISIFEISPHKFNKNS
jgi:hypothetical protein